MAPNDTSQEIRKSTMDSSRIPYVVATITGCTCDYDNAFIGQTQSPSMAECKAMLLKRLHTIGRPDIIIEVVCYGDRKKYEIKIPLDEFYQQVQENLKQEEQRRAEFAAAHGWPDAWRQDG